MFLPHFRFNTPRSSALVPRTTLLELITAQVLFDGTHGIAVNHRTRIRDQERGSIAADVKRIMREESKSGEATFEAHRQIPISRQDWHLLDCQVQPGGDVFVNTVGTFGVASASYYRSRVASAIGRLCQYIPRSSASTWHILVADDYHLDAVAVSFALSSVFLCRGGRRPVVTRCHGWGSNYCIGLTRLVFEKLEDALSGSRDGPEKQRMLGTCTHRPSRKVWDV